MVNGDYFWAEYPANPEAWKAENLSETIYNDDGILNMSDYHLNQVAHPQHLFAFRMFFWR